MSTYTPMLRLSGLWGDDFSFTGRIKYKKYNKRVDLLLEVRYTEITKEYKREWYFGKHKFVSKSTLKTVFMHERAFGFIEVPEEKIVVCSSTY